MVVYRILKHCHEIVCHSFCRFFSKGHSFPPFYIRDIDGVLKSVCNATFQIAYLLRIRLVYSLILLRQGFRFGLCVRSFGHSIVFPFELVKKVSLFLQVPKIFTVRGLYLLKYVVVFLGPFGGFRKLMHQIIVLQHSLSRS